MRKTIKNKILIPLVILFTLSMALLGIFSLNTTNSANATFNVTDTRMRVEDGKRGIRFVSTISKDIVSGYEENGYTVTYGTFIMPAHYIDVMGDITKDNTFGENAKYVWGDTEEPEDESKYWILHSPCYATEIDDDANNLAIYLSVNMNDTVHNWGIKYTSKAYLKAEKAGEETEYEFATLVTDNVSMLDVAVKTMDIADNEMMDDINGFIDEYEAEGYPVDVSYSIVQKYGEVEVKTTGTAKMGTELDVKDYKVPTADAEARYNKDYYYFVDQNLGSLRVKADGSTKIVIDFTAKPVYTNKTTEYVGLYKLNDNADARVAVADSFSIDVYNNEDKATAVLDFGTVSNLSQGSTHVVPLFEGNVVYEVKVCPVSAYIKEHRDIRYLHVLADPSKYQYNGDALMNYGIGERFYLANDINMTEYTGPAYSVQDSWFGGLYTWGFRGTFDGQGHVLYNLNNKFIDVLGVQSTVQNLTIIGNSPKTASIASMALVTRLFAGTIRNCNFDITVPSDINFDGQISVAWAHPRYGCCPIFESSSTSIQSGNTYIPTVENSIFRVEDLSGKITSALAVDSSTVNYVNSYIFTNSKAYNTAPTSEDARINECALNAEFTGDETAFVENNWTVDSKLPALYNRVISHAEDSYAAYVMNTTGNGRVSNGDKQVNVNNASFVIPEASLQAQATGKATHLVASLDGKDFGVITIDKVTAEINDADDLTNIYYLAGGAEASSQVSDDRDKFGAGERFVLTANIDMTGKTPKLGKATSSSGSEGAYGFHGTLDGNGFTVTNLYEPLFTSVGSAGLIKNLSVVSDNVTKACFLRYNYGTVDNCYFDITAQTSGINTVADYGYASSWTNCVFKINSLNPLYSYDSARYNPVYVCKLVNAWKMNNSIVMFNGMSWNDAGQGTPSVAPTELALGGLNDSHVKNFIDNGGNSEVWTNDLTFKSLTVKEDIRFWSQREFVYTDGAITGRTNNLNGYSDGEITVANSTLASLYPGALYPVSKNLSGKEYTRTMIRIATMVFENEQQFANLIYACGGSSNYSNWFQGYLVLGRNMDMAGYTFALSQEGDWSGHHVADRAFCGTLDGNGKTVSNISNFIIRRLGGVASATSGRYNAIVKDLNLVSAKSPLAATLGNVSFINCNFDFDISAIAKDSSASIYGVIADSVDGSSTLKLINTEVSVLNMTSSTLYLVRSNAQDNANGGGSVIVDNVTLKADQANVSAIPFTVTGNVALAENSKKFYTEAETFYYGRYSFSDAVKAATYASVDDVPNATIDGSKALKGTLKDGAKFVIADAKALLGDYIYTNGTIQKTGYIVQADNGSYYTIDIGGVAFAVSDVFDASHMSRGILRTNWQSFLDDWCIAFNEDIDMAGVTMVSNAPGDNSAGYGFDNVIFGNGKTVSNLQVPLFGRINGNGIVKDLTFKNMKEGVATTLISSGGNYNNVTFDIDAEGLNQIYLVGGNASNPARGITTLNDCTVTVKNASNNFVCYVQSGLLGHLDWDHGTLNLNNVKVNMNAGSFRLLANETTAYDLGGTNGDAIDTTIASASITKVPAAA